MAKRSKSSGFLALPEPHHHGAKLIGLLIALGIIAGIALASIYFSQKTEPPPPPSIKIDMVKNETLHSANNNPPGTPTSVELKTKQAELSAKNPPVTLTPEQIQEKQSQLNQ